jgi:hypothetical protein
LVTPKTATAEVVVVNVEARKRVWGGSLERAEGKGEGELFQKGWRKAELM